MVTLQRVLSGFKRIRPNGTGAHALAVDEAANMLTHLNRFDWFSHNWQLNEDKTPFFIKYGHIWFYSGFPNRGDRYNLMQQTWDLIKGN